ILKRSAPNSHGLPKLQILTSADVATCDAVKKQDTSQAAALVPLKQSSGPSGGSITVRLAESMNGVARKLVGTWSLDRQPSLTNIPNSSYIKVNSVFRRIERRNCLRSLNLSKQFEPTGL